MVQITIELSDEALEEWAERARIGGHADAGEAVAMWAECEVEPVDPAEIELLRERMAGDVADDIPLEEGFARIAAKHGITLPSLERKP